ncbi:MAG: GlsB/YeaQ/YmgE family stress response membrane protein [Pseudomonadota bacterium]
MEGIGWFMAIILGGLAGFIAEKIMKADMGLFANIAIGIVGALLFNFILSLAGLGFSGWLAQSIIAVIGACILIAAYRAIRGRG